MEGNHHRGFMVLAWEHYMAVDIEGKDACLLDWDL
jgi:hypothetical protein